MIQTTQYNPAHAWEIIERNVREQNLGMSDHPDFKEWVQDWEKMGPSYALLVDGEAVCCGGVIIHPWRRGEAWMFYSSMFFKYAATCYKIAKKILNQAMIDHDLRRVQALVEPEFEAGKRFVTHLGFKEEGLLKAYGPFGQDLIMFGRTK